MSSKIKFPKFLFLSVVLLIGALFLFQNRAAKKDQKMENHESIKNAQMKEASNKSSEQKIGSSEAVDFFRKPSEKLSIMEQKKWALLTSVLRSKNDNDPRVDKELKNLSAEFHIEIEKQYNELPLEKRNERGFLAFLITRDLQNSQDFNFLNSIFSENPCLSLENCSTPGNSDPHLSGLDQSSANYPQLATLYQLERQINAGNNIFENDENKSLVRQILENASRFPVPVVQKKADAIKSSHPL